MEKISKNKRKNPLFAVIKTVMLVLTLYYSLAMPVLTGAGLIYNRESYGEKLAETGVFFIASGIIMTAGAVLCLFKRNFTNMLSLFFSVGGYVLCMSMLYRLAAHADASGWTDNFTLSPISSMYKSRILPCIFPVLTAVAIAIIQFFSYDLSEYRRERKREKEKKKNAPSPRILDD